MDGGDVDRRVRGAAITFNFVDISGTGTALNLTDDSEANITSPFPFTFYGVTSSNLRVGNNGGILFDRTGRSGDDERDAAERDDRVAMLPFWMTLMPIPATCTGRFRGQRRTGC